MFIALNDVCLVDFKGVVRLPQQCRPVSRRAFAGATVVSRGVNACPGKIFLGKTRNLSRPLKCRSNLPHLGHGNRWQIPDTISTLANDYFPTQDRLPSRQDPDNGTTSWAFARPFPAFGADGIKLSITDQRPKSLWTLPMNRGHWPVLLSGGSLPFNDLIPGQAAPVVPPSI